MPRANAVAVRTTETLGSPRKPVKRPCARPALDVRSQRMPEPRGRRWARQGLTVAAAGLAALTLGGGAHAVTIQGTPGPDRLVGTAAADALTGLGGADRLEGLAGADFLDGGD